MSMSMMKRTAPMSVLCCGVQNGGGVFHFNSTVGNLSQTREDELDGCMEVEVWESCVQPQDLEVEVWESCVQPQDLEKETRELLSQFFRSHIGLCKRSSGHPALPSLQRVADKLLNNHRIAYNGMVQRLFEQANGLDSVNSVLSGVFSDGGRSWGRIASVLALGAVVCERMKQECVKENVEECVDVVTSQISLFISTELRHWFINNNSWDGFVEFFRVEDPESTVRNTLMAVAGLGIGACLLSLMR